MIEVEKKFRLKPGQAEALQQGATFAREVRLEDDYYDLDDWALTKKDWWLRLRNGRWELKHPVPVSPNMPATEKYPQYNEVEDEASIRKLINLPLRGSLAEDLETAGYTVVAEVRSTRRVFSRPPFTLDFDVTDDGLAICEIELMVDRTEEVSPALERILAFARERGLDIGLIRGKVVEAIRKKNPKHYHALVNAGVV
ncbi:MAG: CYTH domain-containing protein [Candidatus Kerfeldbacteria bacterium]|nr:CYTH domain-containing protein [Candidatus Kerfeldbacteria bacterium]